MKFNSKSDKKRSFSYETKASQQGEWIYGTQSLKEKRLLCESVFIVIERRALILKKVQRKVFLMKPKHQYHLSRWREHVYGP